MVERSNFVAKVLCLRLLSFCLCDFLLPHQRADLLRHAVALPLERLYFRQRLAPLPVGLEDAVNELLVPCPARGQARAHELRFLTNQFDVEHARIIGTRLRVARRKPDASARHRTSSNANPFKYSVSGIIGITGWSGDCASVATRRRTCRVSNAAESSVS